MVTYDMGPYLGVGSFRHHGDFLYVSLAFFFLKVEWTRCHELLSSLPLLKDPDDAPKNSEL